MPTHTHQRGGVLTCTLPMPFSSQDCLCGTRLTILSYNSLDPRGVWLRLREATPSTAHETCEFLNSMRPLPMLHLLFLFLFFFSFIWSLLIHHLKFRCGPQGCGRFHLLHILCSTTWAGAPAVFPESQGHTSSVSTPVAKPF